MVLVSVVFDPGYDDELAAASLASLQAQILTSWERVGSLSEATGTYVSFLDAGDQWVPDRLARLAAVAQAGAPLVADEMEGVRGNGETVLFAAPAPDIEPARLLARRDLVAAVSTDPAWVLDLLLSRPDLVVRTEPRVGVRRRFPDRRRAIRPRPGHHRNAVLNRHLVDWPSLEARRPTPGLTSVLVPTFEDAELTTACVESVLAAGGEVEVVVWDNRSAPEIATALDSLAPLPGVRVEHASTNHGFALGNNLALGHARGDVVVFLNNDTTVSPGWLTPLRRALQGPEVLGVQPLLLYPSGSIQSAGVVFPATGGLPHPFLQGFPVEDAAGIDDLRFHAITGAAMALRMSDVAALRGFDAIYTNGMEDVDLCHRLAELRPEGYFRVVTDLPVVHHESRTPGRFDKHLVNRQIYLDRWHGVREPRDDVEKWATRRLTVLDHQSSPRSGQPMHLAVPQPVLVRTERLHVIEPPPGLRWALKNPAPAGPAGERWGDTPFADSLASALRGLGQQVVIDRRPEWDRPTGHHDDIALALRGLVALDPRPEQVSIAWVISHPEDVTPQEAARYDRVLAAGPGWAERRSAQWGLPIEPLLQATDPDRFAPPDPLDRPDQAHPVLFVGNSRRVLRPVVRDALACGLAVRVYGDLWTGLVPDDVVVARSLPNPQLSAAYAAAGVVLNDHHEPMRLDGFVSNRLFDAAASGARVITDDVATPPGGLTGLFGDSVQVYRSPADLARLADPATYDVTYGDAAARRDVAERVRAEHSFGVRAARLVEVALEARRARSDLRRG